MIYRGYWIGLCVGVKKNCYGQWNCLIWWFELFFLVILSDFGVQCVIGFGRLWDFKRTNGSGWRGSLFAMFSRIELHNVSGQWDCWICWSESVFLVFFLVLDRCLKALGPNLKLWIQWCLDFRPSSKVALSILSELTGQCVVLIYRQGSCPFLMDFVFFFQQFCELEDLMITDKRT